MGAKENLDRAVNFMEMAVAETPMNHPWRSWWLNNLSLWLADRYELDGDDKMDDLDRSIAVGETAMEITPPEHPLRSGLLNNLGNNLRLKYQASHKVEHIERSIQISRMAVDEIDSERADRAGLWLTLGYGYEERYRSSETPSNVDIEQALVAYENGWSYSNAPPLVRINAAQRAAIIHASMSRWENSRALLEQAIQLLPVLSPRSLQHYDKQHVIKKVAGLATMAAAMALNARKEPYQALKLLELGRCIIASLLLEMRTDISELEQQHPELAKEFVALQDELDSPTNTTAPLTTFENTSSAESEAKRRREAEKKFLIVLEKIRSKQGFLNFLLPPTPDELKIAADRGPVVVINVSSYRCDAFLVRHDRPVQALELRDLHLKDLKGKTKSLRTADPYRLQQMLRWLWDVAASPIMEELGFKTLPSEDNWPHIWWILTGQLSQLPFHAAGRHFKGSKDTVLDRVISSYSSSIKALIYGRRHRGPNPTQQALENALLITVPESGLPFALDEVAMLEELCPSLELHPVKPVPQRDQILAQLRACKIFHFASHGWSNPLEPSESCLVLGEESDPVTVADLRDCRLQENSPFLAYLSACSTKVNDAERLVDEEIHLVSACQLAGFRHVVGTLWEVSDKYCVDVARDLYETIRDDGMTDDTVAWGLHRAIRALRDNDIAMMQSKEGRYTTGNVKFSGYETDDRGVMIQQEHDDQPEAKTASVHDISNVHNDETSALEGKRGQRAYLGKAEITHGETIVPRNNNNMVNAGGEQQRGEDGPDSGNGKPQRSHWSVPSGSLRLSGPLIWAAYIHAGL